MHSTAAKVPEVRPLHAQLIFHAVVEHLLSLPTMPVAEISRTFIYTVEVLVELFEASFLDVLEDLHGAVRDLLTKIDAGSRVLGFLPTKHELCVDSFALNANVWRGGH